LEQSFLDLYFRVDQQVELGVKGKGTIHLSGYIEPDEEGLVIIVLILERLGFG
jgi:hypothetical protein